ncbi:MAG: UDP-glucose/GDP-mannose dehydrogenase family protein [Acidobacteriota bacterium]
MKICVMGTGYVGLVTGACFAEFGVKVTCVDTIQEKVDALCRGEIPIHEPGLEEVVGRNLKEGRLHFTTDADAAIRDARVVFIAVGTPSLPDGHADLSYVESVATACGRNLNDYKVIVTKSTVPARTGEKVRNWVEAALDERRDKGEAVPEFSVASNPEFLREGSAVEDFMRPNRVVLGAEDERALKILKELYRPLYLIETPFVETDVVTAELIKYASNAFLATKISFINEVANLAEVLGADVHRVARAMGLDQRISRKFLHAGPGYGGSCLPKDTRALAHIGQENGSPLKLIEATIQVNESQLDRMLEKIKRGLGGELEGRTVAVLGLSFKPNTQDTRESRGLELAQKMIAAGVTVRSHDPVALDEALEHVPEIVRCENAYDAAAGADLVILATEWNQYRMLDFEHMKQVVNRAVFLDMRNVYNPETVREAGFDYEGVGRGGRFG